MKKLSNRLLKLAEYVVPGSFVADIGSDHCLLPIFLCQEGLITGAFAVDNKKGPYGRMVEAIEEAGLEDKISHSLSDGIEKLDPRCDTVVLAGMGGRLISEILTSHKERLENVKYILVDAHTDLEFVYEALASLGYKIEMSTFLIDKGKPYDIMRWKKAETKPSYTELEKKYGYFNIRHPNEAWREYYARQIEVSENIKKALPKDSDKISELDAQIQEIKNILKIGE